MRKIIIMLLAMTAFTHLANGQIELGVYANPDDTKTNCIDIAFRGPVWSFGHPRYALVYCTFGTDICGVHYDNKTSYFLGLDFGGGIKLFRRMGLEYWCLTHIRQKGETHFINASHTLGLYYYISKRIRVEPNIRIMKPTKEERCMFWGLKVHYDLKDKSL